MVGQDDDRDTLARQVREDAAEAGGVADGDPQRSGQRREYAFPRPSP